MIKHAHKGDVVLVPMLVTKATSEGDVTLRRLDDYVLNDTFTMNQLHVEVTDLNFRETIGARVRFNHAFFEPAAAPAAQDRFGKWWPDIENYARAANAGTHELPVLKGAWYNHAALLMRYRLHIPLYACELSDDEAFGDGCDWIETVDTFRPKLHTKCLDPDDPVRRIRIIVFAEEVESL
ncbi:MAG: hypothetical protein GY851_17800 [bacterium]|nr:hypothetical protein [bacterium]